MKKVFFGVDSGLDGALARIDGETFECQVEHLQFQDKDFDVDWFRKRIFDLMIGYDIGFLTLEKIQGDPKFQGGFNWGKNYGMVKASCILSTIDNNIHLILPSPQAWQKKVLVSSDKTTKERSIGFCKQFYQRCNLIPPGCRKESHDFADSIAIAHYGLLLYNKG